MTLSYGIGCDLFFAFSLTPSLLPRSFAFQGLVSGVLLTLGDALGVWGRWTEADARRLKSLYAGQ